MHLSQAHAGAHFSRSSCTACLPGPCREVQYTLNGDDGDVLGQGYNFTFARCVKWGECHTVLNRKPSERTRDAAHVPAELGTRCFVLVGH